MVVILDQFTFFLNTKIMVVGKPGESRQPGWLCRYHGMVLDKGLERGLKRKRGNDSETLAAECRRELDALIQLYSEVSGRKVRLEENPSASDDSVVANLLEGCNLPLSKLVEEIREGVTISFVRSTVMSVGERVMYGVVNPNTAEILEDDSESCMWGWERFFLGGRLIFGPDGRSLILTVFLIVVPVVLFVLFVSRKLVHEFEHHLGNLIVIIAVIVALYDLVLLFLTSGRDPGIIPRNVHPPEPDDDGRSSTMSADWTGSHYGTNTSSLPPTKNVLVNGIVVKVKYCHTCMLYRPLRCSHCSICNNCVERFDHHCPWVGQCIGKRNYRSFFMFVSTTALLCLYVFAFCWVNLKKIMAAYECNLWRAILKSPVSWILIIYTFIGAWFAGGLTAFHLYLVCKNQTTYENFRYRYDGKMNPYNRGCALNIKEIFFSGIPESKNNFRAKVKDSPALPSSLALGFGMSPNFAKRSFDLDMGGRLFKRSFDLDMGGRLSKRSFDLEMRGKRQSVPEEEFEDIQSQIEIQRLERCRTRPPHLSLGSRKSWELTPDLQMLAAEFGMEHGFGEKIEESP